jgi:hypothetical protein
MNFPTNLPELSSPFMDTRKIDFDVCFGPSLIPGVIPCPYNADIVKETRCLKCYQIYSDSFVKEQKKQLAEKKRLDKDKEKEDKLTEKKAKEQEKKKKISVYDMKMEIINTSSEYQEHKKLFESTFIKIAGEWNRRTPEGNLATWTKRAVEEDNLSKKNFKYDPEGINKDFKFFNDLYLVDDSAIEYIDTCFHPDGYVAKFDTSKYYNKWTGFEQEKNYKEYIDNVVNELEKSGAFIDKNEEDKDFITLERIKKDCEGVRNHIKIIVGDDPEKDIEECDSFIFFVRVLAWIIKNPGTPLANIIILLKDCAGFIEESGGTGKTKWFEWFFEFIIGHKYCVTTTDNNDIYGKFNSLFDEKIFCLIEEASGGANFENSGQLKGKITSKRGKVEKKNKDPTDKEFFINYFSTTNESNAMLVDRRVAVFSPIKKYRCDVDYFTKLDKHLNDPLTQVSFYAYLKLIPTFNSVAEAGNSIPKVEARQEMIRIQADPIKKWLSDWNVLTYINEPRGSTELYYNFKTFMLQMGEAKSEKSILSHTKFGEKIMSKDAELIFVKKRSKSGYVYTANIPEIIKILKKQELLPADFEFVPPSSNSEPAPHPEIKSSLQ